MALAQVGIEAGNLRRRRGTRTHAFRRRRRRLGAYLDTADAHLHWRCSRRWQGGAASGMGDGRGGARGGGQARWQRQGLRWRIRFGRWRRCGAGPAQRWRIVGCDGGSGARHRACRRHGLGLAPGALRGGCPGRFDVRGRHRRFCLWRRWRWQRAQRRRHRQRRTHRRWLRHGRCDVLGRWRVSGNRRGGAVVVMDFACMQHARCAVGQCWRWHGRRGSVRQRGRRRCLAAFEEAGAAPPQGCLRGPVRALQQPLQEAAHGCTRSR